MKLTSTISIALAFAAWIPADSLSAQQKAPVARQFLFDEYRTVIFADLKLMRDSGVWDELQGSGLKLVVGLIEKEISFSLSRLDRITSVQRPVVEAGVDPSTQRSVEQVALLEGNGDLGDASDGTNRYEAEQVGDYQLLVGKWSRDSVVQVSPTMRVYGPAELLKPVLSGKPRTGLPSADVLSLTAGKKNLLAYLVADVKSHLQPRESLEQMLPDAAWPEDDKPTHMGVRLLATGDKDDLHLTLEWVVRHGKDGQGLVATEKAVAAALQRLREVKEARILRPLLKKITNERDGTDAVWRVDLGRARQALGMFGTLVPFLFFARSSEVQVQRLAAPQPVLVEEAPKPKKAKAKGDAKKEAPKPKKAPKPVTTGGGN